MPTIIRPALLASLLASTDLAAQAQPPDTDATILREARLVASSGRVDLYEDGVAADTALAAHADRALRAMERVAGLRYDDATLGPRVRVIVSARVTVAHVWRGYEHPRDPRGIVFLNPRVARLALRGVNATYAHELAHLLTWRFSSHSLREGFADWLALQLHPDAGVGPNPDGYASAPPVGAEVLALLGSTARPPAELSSGAEFRSAYYYGSYRFVQHLIARGGVARFLELYAAADPLEALPRLYGARREALVADAFAAGR